MRMEFQVARFGSGEAGDVFEDLDDAVSSLRSRLARIEGPYACKDLGGDYGADGDLEAVVADAMARIDAGEPGMRIVVAGVDRRGRKLVVRKRPRADGPIVLTMAMSQVGVPYVWADENPKGPAGGPRSGFDCSGLIKWCYAQADVDLPHHADSIMRDPDVTTFDDGAIALPGDLIFYRYSAEPGHADHIAMFAGEGRQVAASSAHDQVVEQSVDWPHVIRLGYVADVTGEH